MPLSPISARSTRPLNDDGWQPILDCGLGDRAAVVLSRLAGMLRADLARHDLGGGSAGLAVCHTYLHVCSVSPDGLEVADRFLSASVDALERSPMGPGLFGGFTGIAWSAEHLGRRNTVQDFGDSHSNIDEALRAHLLAGRTLGGFDLITGLVGLGIYALERFPHDAAGECLELVVERLDACAERSAEGSGWWIPLADFHPLVREARRFHPLDTGIAHGAAGVVSLLAHVVGHGVGGDKAAHLLEESVRWLRAQDGYLKPIWCRGELGTVLALLTAARQMGEADWESAALRMADRAAGPPQERFEVKHAGLCHGAAGIAHLYNRLFQMTGREELRDAGRFWFNRLLDMLDEGVSPTRFGGEPGSAVEMGLLTGVAGVVLALLAGISSVEPSWDRVLLLSSPPRTD